MNSKLEIKGGTKLSIINSGSKTPTPIKGKIITFPDSSNLRVRFELGNQGSFEANDATAFAVIESIVKIIEKLRGKPNEQREIQKVLKEVFGAIGKSSEIIFGNAQEKSVIAELTDVQWSGDKDTNLYVFTEISGEITCNTQLYSKSVRLKHAISINSSVGKGYVSPVNFGRTTVTGALKGGALVNSEGKSWSSVDANITITSNKEGIIALIQDAIRSISVVDIDEIIDTVRKLLDPRKRVISIKEITFDLITGPNQKRITEFERAYRIALLNENEALRVLLLSLLTDVLVPINVASFPEELLNKPLIELPILGPSSVEDIKFKLGAVKVGDLVEIGSEISSITNTDGTLASERTFSPERLRTEMIKAELRRGLANLSESDIDRVIDDFN